MLKVQESSQREMQYMQSTRDLTTSQHEIMPELHKYIIENAGMRSHQMCMRALVLLWVLSCLVSLSPLLV